MRTGFFLTLCTGLLWGGFQATSAEGVEAPAINYAAINSIFQKHCLDCHSDHEPDGGFVLETFEALMQGGESGPALVPGKSEESLLIQLVKGELEKNGKKWIMPPGRQAKLTELEIALLTSWIDQGARAPLEDEILSRELVVPAIAPKVPPRNPILALAVTGARGTKLLAAARYGMVEIRSAETRALVRTLTGHAGNVNGLAFSADGKVLFSAAGQPGISGEVRQWNVADGKLLRTFSGHRDALYALALSPDGKVLATGGYDQTIKLWDVETGAELRTIAGHNGAVYDLAFRPDGQILASASADRTVKLWDVTRGERRETLAQSLKELHAVAFSPDGRRLVSGGVDNRIRFYQISESAAETTNPLLESKYAHEGAILRLVFSPDGKALLSSAEDGTVKIWEAAEMKERLLFEKQPDWAPGLAFLSETQAAVGRLDGTLEFYEAANGNRVARPRPELIRAEPRGVQSGETVRMKLTGKNLGQISEVKTHHPKLRAEWIGKGLDEEAWIEFKAEADLPRGTYELSVAHRDGESGRIKIYVDDIPQFQKQADGKVQRLDQIPAVFWGSFERMGDVDVIEFKGCKGQTVVFDARGKSLGSKAGAVLAVLDSSGRELARSAGWDEMGEPLVAVRLPADGRYSVRLHEMTLGASPDHFYRLTMGEFPFVTDIFPLGVRAGSPAAIELIGFNLPEEAHVKILAGEPGEQEVPLDPEKFRSRRAFKVIVNDGSERVEMEPNDQPDQATMLEAPAAVNGRIWNQERGGDVDHYQFEARAGENWIIETAAAQRGSPMDTMIEVLHPDGAPVERVLLQAVRDTFINFRPINSNAQGARLENWEEMELNDHLYLQGEVVRLFRMPQGPDSDMIFYSSQGKRRAYFDTTPIAHPLDEICYIVKPYPPGTELVPNGLPVFPLYYANDDDGERKLGTDSKIHFTAPSDGTYVVRVSDTRGASGPRFVYRLVVRRAQPDFSVSLSGANPTINAGSGKSFSVSAERLDGFEDEIHFEITGAPDGFEISSPLVIEAGHRQATGTIFAHAHAREPDVAASAEIKVVARARIGGEWVSKEAGTMGRIKLTEKPKLLVNFEPESAVIQQTASVGESGEVPDAEVPLEIIIAPGGTVPAWLRVERNGHDDLITFTVENLPHGVIVDNIGLNGVLLPPGESEREIFLQAARWVEETDRLCYAIENQAGRQTSRPVLLKVRKR
jgi:WD40 repeat protein